MKELKKVGRKEVGIIKNGKDSSIVQNTGNPITTRWKSVRRLLRKRSERSRVQPLEGKTHHEVHSDSGQPPDSPPTERKKIDENPERPASAETLAAFDREAHRIVFGEKEFKTVSTTPHAIAWTELPQKSNKNYSTRTVNDIIRI